MNAAELREIQDKANAEYKAHKENMEKCRERRMQQDINKELDNIQVHIDFISKKLVEAAKTPNTFGCSINMYNMLKTDHEEIVSAVALELQKRIDVPSTIRNGVSENYKDSYDRKDYGGQKFCYLVFNW